MSFLLKVGPELESLMQPADPASLPVPATSTMSTSPSSASLASALMLDGMKAVGNTVSKLTRTFSTLNAEQVN